MMLQRRNGQTLTTWNPFAELERFSDQVNHLFAGEMPAVQAMSAFAALDVRELGDRLVITTDLPGMRREDISLQIKDNVLTLQGERQRPEAEQQDPETAQAYRYLRRERVHGSFTRRLTLPADLDTTTVKATYRDGVLTVEIPKREEAQPRTITIEAA